MANSKIYLGSTNIGSLFQGADDISIYLGENKVYPLAEPFKWKATYSDSSVTSAECDASSAIVRNEINLTNLVSVEIGDCVTSIGRYAFTNCRSLTSIDIPDSVTSIGDYAFSSCSGLTSIDIPSGITRIGDSAFEGCSSLTNIVIPDSVTTIRQNAFTNCSGLTSITVEATTPPTLGLDVFEDTNNCPIYVPCESVEAYKSASRWSDYASRISCIEPPFQGKWKATYSGGETYDLTCDGNTTLTTTNTKPTGYEYSAMTSAIIGDCVTTINGRILWGCTSLTSVTIPDSVTSIGTYAFYDCSSLTSIDIPSGVTSIANGTFESCSSLSSVDLPSGVTSIGDGAFYWCSGLTSIVIPDSVTSIGSQSFSYCSSLTSIDIPSGVTSIGNSAFQYCSSLTSITVNAITPPTLGGATVFNNTNDCPIIVPCESVNTYKAASEWSRYASRITCLNPPTYTYYVDIQGLEGKDTCDIDWKNIKIDYAVGNGSYTITTTADTVDVSITNYDDRSYSVDYDSFTLTSNNPGKLVTFTYQGGGNLQYIPQGTDMTQYYNRTITRFKIGDSSLSSDYSQVRPTFQTGGYGQIDAWGGVNLNFGGTQITSLPCDVSGSDTLTEWVCLDSNWTSSNNNPFTDLWIEFA